MTKKKAILKISPILPLVSVFEMFYLLTNE